MKLFDTIAEVWINNVWYHLAHFGLNDAVDIALMNLCKKGDIVVTQDYGVAAMALGKGAYAIHHNGKRYTDDNIDVMLMERHLAKKARRASGKHHLHGPAKFTDEDRSRFTREFEALMLLVTGGM